MALIKCNECGKEISDKSTSCIHCGCPVVNEERKEKDNIKTNSVLKGKKKNNVWSILRYILAIFLFLLFIGMNLTFLGYISLILLELLIIPYTNNYIKNKISIPKVLKFIIIIVLFFITTMNTNYETPNNNSNGNNQTNQNENNSKEENKNNKQEIVDNRTPKEKLIEYLKKSENATCDENKCTFTFSTSFTSSTDYYTIDFVNKKIILDNKDSNGNVYREYDYANQKGYAKSDTTYSGIRMITEVNVTYNSEKQNYTYKCESNISTYTCDETDAKLVVSLKDSLDMYCNNAKISVNDL